MVLRKRRQFKIKLPGNHRLFVPEYHVTLYLVGDIIIFRAAQLNEKYFFIGKIVRIGKDADQQWYDVDCILRPKGRDPERLVNWLPKARIHRKSILCEIKNEDSN